MKADGQIILNKYISLPEKLQEEVEDFIDFLGFKQQRQEKFPQEGIVKKKESNKRKKKKSNFGRNKVPDKKCLLYRGQVIYLIRLYIDAFIPGIKIKLSY